ncbi:(ABC) transporter [Seminavis robusta]|uniref:(ABC) transporter n=1 Tax=Seminavis robusta TaxID=568900 RepID=A0A9N8F0Q4_9STRA|nr:(ABC) transporter [Seminavis robusta]|eukprot:Sro2866_g338940.1 (ABC) transporter (118) ;mRNA; f:288-641
MTSVNFEFLIFFSCIPGLASTDDWASHLFYLTNNGACGWQGKMSELEYYEKLKQQNHPCKMLAIADHWLRKELEQMRKEKRTERAQGEMARPETYDNHQGGYASGRLLNAETDEMET